MKLVCAQTDLSTNLSLVSRAVPSRPSHPVLANVKLEADPETSTVSLTAFDLSLGIQTTFTAQVEEAGTLALPAKLFNDIVSRLPDGDVTLETDPEMGDGCIATLISTSGQYQVRGMAAEEFPELPTPTSEQAIHLPISALRDGLRGTLFSTSPDETKQVLTGVHLMVDADSLEFAATDGHRLSVVCTENQTEGETAASSLQMTIPARALRELERMINNRNDSEALAVHLDPGQIVFELEGQRITSRTLDGQYPAYRQLIPKQFARQITLDRRQLISSLERIAVLADQKNNLVKFSLDQDAQRLFLSVESKDVGSGRESLPAQVSGENLDIAFNVKYLMEGLKVLSTSEIQLQVNSSETPAIVTPLGGLQMTYLIMPVQLR